MGIDEVNKTLFGESANVLSPPHGETMNAVWVGDAVVIARGPMVLISPDDPPAVRGSIEALIKRLAAGVGCDG